MNALTHIPVLRDDFGIGLPAVARIQMKVAQKTMGEAAPDAFATGYMNPEWRAMQRRRFYAARQQYETAKGYVNDAR